MMNDKIKDALKYIDLVIQCDRCRIEHTCPRDEFDTELLCHDCPLDADQFYMSREEAMVEVSKFLHATLK